MNRLDRALQKWRIQRAIRWIPHGARVLDIGCFDDHLFRKLGDDLGFGLGLDPLLPATVAGARYEIIPASFPDAAVPGAPFDVVTMLAVLEHVPEGQLKDWADACHELLVPGGRVVATIPSPMVDRILDVLLRLKILDGMEEGLADQHHGFDPSETAPTFERSGFTLLRAERFQLGLNNLFVLTRT